MHNLNARATSVYVPKSVYIDIQIYWYVNVYTQIHKRKRCRSQSNPLEKLPSTRTLVAITLKPVPGDVWLGQTYNWGNMSLTSS